MNLDSTWEAVKMAGAESFPPEKYEKFENNIKALEAHHERLYRLVKSLLAFFEETPGITLPREQAGINAMWRAAREMRAALNNTTEQRDC